jgi:hypothetical protein
MIRWNPFYYSNLVRPGQAARSTDTTHVSFTDVSPVPHTPASYLEFDRDNESWQQPLKMRITSGTSALPHRNIGLNLVRQTIHG